ncbi:MAG: cytochrome C [Desulfuromonadales bacterium]|nr:cytochrome C [Desulfuromonadales bacterium]
MAKWVGQAIFGAAVLAGFLFLVSCMQPRSVSDPLRAERAAPPMPAERSEAPLGAEEDPYAEPVQPLTVRQCGQCHPSIYNALREEGLGHKFACQGCHEKFHVADQQEAMPRCLDCHGEPHVNLDKFRNCLTCHDDAHAPRRLGITVPLIDGCADCHRAPGEDLRLAPSAHTALGCISCHHDRHGLIPSCLECHQPHFASQPAPACLSCHPAHQPKQLAFSPPVDPRTCAGCHGEVYRQWSATPSRHGAVGCVECHAEHALVPKCTECHPQPHSEKILAAYPRCLTCHLDPHNPPVKRP